MRSGLFIFVVCGLIAQACGFDDDDPTNTCTPVTVAEQEDLINDYIDQQGWTMQTTASGLRYAIETPGTGDNIMVGNTISLDYQGALLNGNTFDAGSIGPDVFTANAFIPGFQEGLQLFNDGSEGLMIIPSALAYGCFPPQGSIIGQNEVLVFEVSNISVDP
jgi:FKBP-type peptidyl-prolyl cis-trans isomerase FkpA